MRLLAGRSPALLRLGLIAGVLIWALGAQTAGAVTCPNEAHRTGASAALPDCRAYEMVSPAVKSNSVSVDPTRFRVSQQEGPGLPTATIFQSLGGFADPLGSGIAFDYMAQRTLEPRSQGWSTHALTPLQSPLPFAMVGQGFDPLFVGEASPDLTKLVHRTTTELTPAPNLPKIAKLFVRNDLRNAGRGTYQLISDSAAAIAAPVLPLASQMTHVADSSTDLSHVLIESTFALTPNAPATTQPKLYMSVNGAMRLVGILPATEGGAAAARSIAGQGAGASLNTTSFTPNTLSDDGRRAFWTVTTTGATGNIYMRDNLGTLDTADDISVRLNATERTPTPDTVRPATYWNAAEDGSRVIIQSGEALTNDAPTGNVQKLYVYDTTKPASDPNNLTYVSPDLEPGDAIAAVIGVMDVSADGRTVYFIQRGQIVAGQPVLDQGLGIYAWREGRGVKYVGQMVDDVIDDDDTMPIRQHSVSNQWGAKVTPGGRFLLVSLRQPPWANGYDQGNCGGAGRPIGGRVGCPQLYLYDYDSGAQPVCVSCPGSVPTGAATFALRVGAGGSASVAHRNTPITDDGSLVFFSTVDRLVPEDANSVSDAYQYDVATRSLHLLSSGTSAEPSYFVEASADGRDVFIASREKLSPWDVDRDMDIYDARIDGGVVAPTISQECTGDACQGDLATPPSEQTAATSQFSAAVPRGRVTMPRGRRRGRSRACRRGRVRRRVDGRIRCVTRARAQRLAAAQRAHERGRGGAR